MRTTFDEAGSSVSAFRQTSRGRRGEHLPTLAISAFWFWIVLLVLLCGCGALFITVVPIFPSQTAGPPRVLATEPPLTATLPQPTETRVAQVVSVVAKVIEDRVNFRAAPSTESDIVGKLGKDDQLTLLGHSKDGKWYQALTKTTNTKGWVFGETIQVIEGDSNSLPVVEAP